MKAKDFNQALALQMDLSAKLVTNVDKLRKSKAPSVAATVKDQEKLIAQAKAELGTTEKDRTLAIKRWDQKVKRRKTTVGRLENGLNDLKKKATQVEKAKEGRVIRKKKRP
jgi:hypothetical protein